MPNKKKKREQLDPSKNKIKNELKSTKSSTEPEVKSSALISPIYVLYAVLSLSAGMITPFLIRHESFNLSKYNLMMDEYILDDVKSVPIVTLDVGKERDNLNKESDTTVVECSSHNLSMFVHDHPMNGMHILCADENYTIRAWRNAVNEFNKTVYNEDFMNFILHELQVKPHYETKTQPWAIFSTNGDILFGEREVDVDALEVLKGHGMTIFMEGGNWIWPGLRIGFVRNIDIVTGFPVSSSDHPTIRTIEMETVSLKPLVVSVKNFILKSECDHIQKLASPDMRYSGVTLMDHDQGKEASEFRTSQSTFLQANDDIIHALEKRTASLSRIPKHHQEHTQVLRYAKNERYVAHLDYFDPSLYKSDQGTLRLIQNGMRNRLATVFWYLSDVEEGGETNFPRFNGAPQPHDFGDCGKGLKVVPEKGKVIIFYSLGADGKRDEYSLHAACPVKEGIKWAANKWIWNAPMSFVKKD